MLKRLKAIILDYLKAGMSHREVSLAVSLGIIIGIFPIYGLATAMCLGLAWATRLNAPIMMASVYSMSFVKPLLIIPFLKMGEWMFQADPMGIALADLMSGFAQAPLATLREFSWSFTHALVAWLAVIPILVPILYRLCLMIVRRLDGFRKRGLL
ncbi:MAG: hypothetical protein ACI9OU_001566 [Candidatus Promineifilaceae bacterium]|jgi:uncharacterized protein (DUF2062 family)